MNWPEGTTEEGLKEVYALPENRLLRFVIPERYRPITADAIAATLLRTTNGDNGVVIVESESIWS